MDLLEQHLRTTYGDNGIDVIVGLDSRGFLMGPILAMRFGIPFTPIRKQGKLPGPVTHIAYTKEYGKDVFEIQNEGVKPGQRVVIIDDLLATGGTMKAAADLIVSLQATVLECLLVIELSDLNGREALQPHTVFSLVQY
eukprot:TRINITY_DN1164_c0_g2_i3.p2 TRINITY_DN1164_c0_g2~~TRINITY_DN1164_c0_g2_i3.p2  ORF type:complete len:139 (+),score=53.96 TRINITY_DN1164_c0_g2_i3:166-582(+)